MIGAVAWGLALLGCAPAPDSAGCGDPALDWHEFGQPFMEEYCLACHSEGVRSGQLPLEIEFLQSDPAGDSGFRFRITDGDAQVCPPVFDE